LPAKAVGQTPTRLDVPASSQASQLPQSKLYADPMGEQAGVQLASSPVSATNAVTLHARLLRSTTSMNTQFSCVGCGKCCTDHHVPLTLPEARQWAADGGAVIVLAEAFLEDGYGVSAEQRRHAERRSCRVPSGSAQAYVAITFAAFNVGRCRNLDAENLCRIYERRPLVCRIYPMEINPHIPLRPEAKDCPPESWGQGPDLIVGGKLVDTELPTATTSPPRMPSVICWAFAPLRSRATASRRICQTSTPSLRRPSRSPMQGHCPHSPTGRSMSQVPTSPRH
jgi:Fe-S-cluster containining protein